jgi:CII-binding regulator of phage lambda lysogenization HflD
MLPFLVKEQLEHYSYNEAELIDFIAAIYAESVPVDLVKIWDIDGGANMENNRKEMSAIVDVIGQRLHPHW